MPLTDDELLASLARYDEALVSKSSSPRSSALVSLNIQRDQLAQSLRSDDDRKDGHLTESELALVTDWKLARGKWRPRLAQLVRENSEEDVKRITTEAHDQLMDDGDPDAALKTLTALRGIGPATASAVLALWSPNQCFLSDELCAVIGMPKLKYTAAECVEARDKVREPLAADERWQNAEAYEKACWAWTILNADGPTSSKKRTADSSASSSKKRKA